MNNLMADMGDISKLEAGEPISRGKSTAKPNPKAAQLMTRMMMAQYGN